MTELQTLLDDLVYPESPRWHDGWLWFSDIPRHRVMRWSASSGVQTVVDTSREAAGAQLGPSGLGFLPDGTGVIAMMSESGPLKGKVLGFDDRRSWVHADLSHLTQGRLNDMVVSETGHIYVGALDSGQILHISPSGQTSIALSDVQSPNGMVVTPGGEELRFVTRSSAVFAAPLQSDGSVGAPRLWADFSLEAIMRRHLVSSHRTGPITWDDLDSLSGADGITCDAMGALWVGGTSLEKFIRVDEGGRVTDVIRTPGRHAIACHLGGPDRRTLFMTTAQLVEGTPRTGGHGSPGLLAQLTASKTRGRIEATTVAVPGAGMP